MNELINNEGVCRTAPATPGLLNTVTVFHLLPVLPLALPAAVVDELALTALLHFVSWVSGLRPAVGNTVDTLLG